ncbi:MAG: maltose O-acetyltransferase [Akkermansiaceae bacterium]|jgi:maltose O-acetyltransferase
MNRVYLAFYYIIARHFPTQPVPGWKTGYRIRRFLLERIVKDCGQDVIVKRNCYFGKGTSLEIGSRSQLGEQARIGPHVKIGDDVLMGPEVVIMTTSHSFDDLETPIRLQPEPPQRGVVIGNDVWIGTRVTILPGVTIGNGAIIGACSVVTKDIPEMSVAAGNPARVIRRRGQVTNS